MPMITANLLCSSVIGASVIPSVCSMALIAPLSCSSEAQANCAHMEKLGEWVLGCTSANFLKSRLSLAMA